MSNRRLLAVVRKEFIHVLRDPRSLAVAVIIPLVMLLIYGYGINRDIRHVRVAVMDMDNTGQSRDLLEAFTQSGYFDFVAGAATYTDLERSLDSGRASLAIVVPRGFAADLAEGNASLQVITDGSDAVRAGLVTGYVSQISRAWSLKAAVGKLAVSGPALPYGGGLDVRQRFWYNPELKSSNFLIPGLVAIILMIVSALLTSMTVVRERERGTFEQLAVSPVRPAELVIGKLIPYALIAFTDILLVILGGLLIFRVPLVGSFAFLLAASLLFLLAALGLGMLISCTARTQLAAMTTAFVATMLPTILLSGFIFPISAMPLPVRMLTYLTPARYFLVVSRGVFLKGTGLSVLWPEMLLLLISGVALTVLSVRSFRKML